MIETRKIIEDLEAIRHNPRMFVDPVSPELLSVYLAGFQRGVFLSQSEKTFSDFVDAHRFAMRSKGLKRTAAFPYRELREKGFDEDRIILEMIELEIEMWRILARFSGRKQGKE